MCGIVGYCGSRNASEVLLSGLKRLEYRGYDSSGICLSQDGKLQLYKKKGKIAELRKAVPEGLTAITGIGHTRWATHGEVNDVNAHPHLDNSNQIAIVHNGIIENFKSLREMLEKDGVKFLSETDSEVMAHLVARFFNGDLEEAVREALLLVRGTYGLIVMHKDKPGVLVGARNGSPLVIGIGNNETFLASDVSALMAYTNQVIYLEDREVVTITNSEYHTTDIKKNSINKTIESITWELEELEKGEFPHFMLKETFEQVQSIERAFQGRFDEENATAKLGGLNLSNQELLSIERIKIIAAGTSYYAGMVGAYLIESLGRIPCTTELASEIRYRNCVVEKNTLYLALSQSGETADTLFAMRELQRKGGIVLGICNVVGSTIPRESDGGVYIHSGPEIAVASTKAFTSQITALYLLTLVLARIRNLSFEAGKNFIGEMKKVPGKIEMILKDVDKIKTVAIKYAHHKNFLFLGRGSCYPVALEGALKLKEVSYIHAEGYCAAEIKHGPIALINEDTPSFFIVPNDRLKEKVITSMKEVKARKGKIIALCVNNDEDVMAVADDVISVPEIDEFFYPFLMSVPVQLFSYFCALELDRDVDQPRNLAKSVTVE